MSKKKSNNSTNTSAGKNSLPIPARPAEPPAPVKPSEQAEVSAKPRRSKLWAWLGGISLVVGGLLVIGAGATAMAYLAADRVMVKSVTVGGVDVGGQDYLAALNTINKKWQALTQAGFTFTAEGQTYRVPLTGGINKENEVIIDVATFDPKAAIEAAYDFGHHGPWYEQVRQRLSGWLGRRHEFGVFVLSSEGLRGLLRQQLADQETTPLDAGLTISASGQPEIIASKPGSQFDYQGASRQATLRLRSLATDPIVLVKQAVAPRIASNDALQAIADQQTTALLNRAPLTVTAAEKKFEIKKADLIKLIGFAVVDGKTLVGFDQQKTVDWLAKIKKEVDIPPQNAKFSIQSDGRVEEFQTSVVGKTVDAAQTVALMNHALVDGQQSTIAAVITEEKPITDTVAANNLGITELVAEGKTNFRGSPTNRRYNLTLGSTRLNGLLIKPGDTFSLVKALGPIDGAHGWKPELVIKQGGRITPEFGGGLCQVATTLFRAVLNTGLPVVERRNHSLRISYYEPPIGLDATIYEPKPDLRFTNDYPHYLLLQTEVAGNDLIYRFYGTKDGRTVDLPVPKVYNRTPIPPMKTIEVTDLKPGEKECQSPGHPGADATATYTVIKADGQKSTQIFESHYRPIGVICRVGKKKEEAKTPEETKKASESDVDVIEE